jgi:hypothetical protein
MIKIYDQKKYLDLDFRDYIKLPGYSTSFLKREVNGTGKTIEISDKIKIGKLVDAILTEPKNVVMADPLYPMARDIAYEIKNTFGDIIRGLKSQISYTGIMEHNGFYIPVKGRLDFELEKLAALDLKITYSKNIESLIDFMQYKEQMFCYSGLASTVEHPVTKAFLLVYCVPTRKCSVHYIDCSNASPWWCEKIIKFGNVLPIEK